jgi:hypothetical protein
LNIFEAQFLIPLFFSAATPAAGVQGRYSEIPFSISLALISPLPYPSQ